MNTPQPAPDTQFTVDLADYWWILRRRIIWVMVVFVMVFTSVLFLTSLKEPNFMSVCEVAVSSRHPMAIIGDGSLLLYPYDADSKKKELERIASDKRLLAACLAEMIVQAKAHAAKVKDAKENGKAPVPMLLDDRGRNMLARMERENGSLRGMVSATMKGEGSDVVLIKVQGPSPYFTKLAANSMATAYRIDYAEDKTKAARETREFIGSQLDELNLKLSAGMDKLSTVTEEMAKLGAPLAYQAALTRVNIELKALRHTYKSGHPKILKAEARRKYIVAIVQKFPGLILKKEALIADSVILHKMKQDLQALHIRADIEWQTNRTKAKDEVQVRADATVGSQLAPNWSLTVVSGILFAALMSITSTFVREGLDTSIGKIEDVEQLTGSAVIGQVPLLNEPDSSTWFPLSLITNRNSDAKLDEVVLFNFDHSSNAAEAYRQLRTNIQFALRDTEKSQVVAVTSSSPQEGKTLTSVNLAITFAQLGKRVLLVEADMRRSKLASIFKIDRKPGLSDLIIGSATDSQAIRTVTDIIVGGTEWEKLMNFQGIDNLSLIPAGTLPPNPAELVGAAEFRQLIDHFRQQYEFIIIDTPPVLPVTDATIISGIVDGTILVYESDKTSRHLLMRAHQNLTQHNARILGIIINKLAFDVTLPYYRRQYGYSPGYTSDESD